MASNTPATQRPHRQRIHRLHQVLPALLRRRRATLAQRPPRSTQARSLASSAPDHPPTSSRRVRPPRTICNTPVHRRTFLVALPSRRRHLVRAHLSPLPDPTNSTSPYPPDGRDTRAAIRPRPHRHDASPAVGRIQVHRPSALLGLALPRMAHAAHRKREDPRRLVVPGPPLSIWHLSRARNG